MKSRMWKVCLCWAVLAACLTSGANASLVLVLDDGAGTQVIVNDGGAGDASALAGLIQFSGTVGVWELNITSAISKPILGGTAFSEMRLDSFNAKSSSPGTLTVLAYDTGFQSIGGSYVSTLVSTGQVGEEVNVWGYVDPNDGTSFPAGTALHLGPFTTNYGGNPLTDETSASTFLAAGSTYSQAILVAITHSNVDQTTDMDATLTTVVPEPATLAIWSILAGGGALLGARKRRGRWNKNNRQAIMRIVAKK